ncbi:probable glucuronoxylan glucuronosyltransferase F8H [Physcomitrium patens]|uniref:Exostosin GT47 domain-containing protein n=1 Tax=Physcomitrium patens TaxID=3218 RepID=A9TVZ0_PHYPA|nr:probable glucuronoxylan glucuronosyltransferase F8H [Physcomitrium patens]PNR27419.1 hypothetical protein PHYPA_029571 [Physcomitrium patens]|eukprot:XP_024365732.1 probable glucuronoxylan glucuronosyltransferase F8H [Physcomitrella patens]
MHRVSVVLKSNGHRETPSHSSFTYFLKSFQQSLLHLSSFHGVYGGKFGSIGTLDPYEADYFFILVYVSCKFSPKTGTPWLGRARKLMEAAVNHVSTKMEFWNRSGGRDQIFAASQDNSVCFHTLETEAWNTRIYTKLFNPSNLGVQDFHPCQAAEHIQIPPYVSPSVAASYIKDPRNIFAFFSGKMEINPKNVSGLKAMRACFHGSAAPGFT